MPFQSLKSYFYSVKIGLKNWGIWRSYYEMLVDRLSSPCFQEILKKWGNLKILHFEVINVAKIKEFNL